MKKMFFFIYGLLIDQNSVTLPLGVVGRKRASQAGGREFKFSQLTDQNSS